MSFAKDTAIHNPGALNAFFPEKLDTLDSWMWFIITPRYCSANLLPPKLCLHSQLFLTVWCLVFFLSVWNIFLCVWRAVCSFLTFWKKFYWAKNVFFLIIHRIKIGTTVLRENFFFTLQSALWWRSVNFCQASLSEFLIDKSLITNILNRLAVFFTAQSGCA